MNLRNRICSALAFAALTIAPAGAQLSGQLGVLDLDNANGGINPATGNPWEAGDTYRLLFVTSTKDFPADSADINDYNVHVTGVANTAGLAGNWYVVGSTGTVDARDNTATNPTVETGVGVFGVDGTTMYATNNGDLWNGLNVGLTLDQDGNTVADVGPVTGSNGNGTTLGPTGRALGGSTETPPKVRIGRNTNGGQWMVIYNKAASSLSDYYAMSEVLTVIDPSGGPQITSITGIGGGVWELMIEGEASTGYEFYSAADLVFDPGALVENLTAGGVPVGTIGGPNDSVLKTDANGDGTARMTLSGSPADFVRAQDAPLPPPVTLYEEDFDTTTPGSLPADWAAGKNPADNSSLTNWELGTPANVGPIPPGVPLPSASNCVATGIGANYDDPVADLGVAHTDIWLRTPSIDLGTATSGTLSFQQWTEIEDVPGDLDHGSIRILDASDNSELAVMEDQTIDGSTSGWEEYSKALPPAAFTATAGTIKIEFQFEADDIDSFAGWYIDDVLVTVPGS